MSTCVDPVCNRDGGGSLAGRAVLRRREHRLAYLPAKLVGHCACFHHAERVFMHRCRHVAMPANQSALRPMSRCLFVEADQKSQHGNKG